MKFAKTFLKLLGILFVVGGAVLVVLGSLDDIRAFCRRISLNRARREELKDYAD